MQTAESIYKEMKDLYGSLAGLTPVDGGDLELRLRAVAAQIYSLWGQAEFVLRQCFPQTATGEYLDHHGQLRGIARRQAAQAVGTLRFSLQEVSDNAVDIPVGTSCANGGGTRFVTTQAGEIPAGALFADVPAQAVEAGSQGNAPAGTVIYMVLAPTGVAACTNPAAFTDGSEVEEDDSLRGRILGSYQKLPNGANIAYYESQALNVDGVAAVSVLPKRRGVGTVDVVIASATGIPAQSLVDEVQEKLDSQREICVDITVLAPTAKTVDVAATVTVDPNLSAEDVLARVREVITDYFSGECLGQNVLRAKLGNLIYGVKGVTNYVLTVPAADVAVDTDALPVLGTLTITEGAV